jgi:hypothetical protein
VVFFFTLVFAADFRGVASSLRLCHKYQHATVRYGRHASPSASMRLASGRFLSL